MSEARLGLKVRDACGREDALSVRVRVEPQHLKHGPVFLEDGWTGLGYAAPLSCGESFLGQGASWEVLPCAAGVLPAGLGLRAGDGGGWWVTGTPAEWGEFAFCARGETATKRCDVVFALHVSQGPTSRVPDASLLGRGAGFGASVSAAGDLTGDSHGEVVVGAPSEDEGRGGAWVLPGPASAEGDWPEGSAFLKGERPGDAAGFASVGVADFNGDGLPDLAVGAPLAVKAELMSGRGQREDSDEPRFDPYSAPDDGRRTGAVYVFYGPLRRGVGRLEQADLILVGERDMDMAGYALSSGDLDGDGRADLLIGAPGADGEGLQERGAVYAVLGRELRGVRSLRLADARWVGVEAGERVGRSLAWVERPGGDEALSGVAVGLWPVANQGSCPRRAAALVAWVGPSQAPIPISDALLTVTRRRDAPCAPSKLSLGGGGYAVAAGDLDEDGAPELIVAGEGDDPEQGRRVASVFRGDALLDPAFPYRLLGEAEQAVTFTDADLPLSVAVGDLNDDGRDELWIGDPAWTSRAQPEAGAAASFRGATLQQCRTRCQVYHADTLTVGRDPGDRLGAALAPLRGPQGEAIAGGVLGMPAKRGQGRVLFLGKVR
jgi:hypothetical protein